MKLMVSSAVSFLSGFRLQLASLQSSVESEFGTTTVKYQSSDICLRRNKSSF